VGWRKGADVDEELWPVEAFGGITDEQFWDDLASDKPLATTARTAQHNSGPPARSPQAVPARASAPGPRTPGIPVPGGHPQSDVLGGRSQSDVPGGRSQSDVPGGRSQSDEGATQILPAAQPSPAATRPVPVPATRPTPAALPLRTAAQPAHATTQPARTTTQPARTTTQPVRAVGQLGETEGRGRRRSAEEDPLTSAAFALRASGPVDGRSFLAPRSAPDPSRAGSGVRSGTSPYPAAERPYREPGGGPSGPSASANTPPYGESYGLGDGYAAGPAADPRRHDSRPRHGRDEYGASHLNGTGSPGGLGGRPGGGSHRSHPGNGYRGPSDPWSQGRRLTTPHRGVRDRGDSGFGDIIGAWM
jgi:hypothetical protein